MFRTRMGAHSIVYGAEMDGLEVSDGLKLRHGLLGSADGIDLNSETFVELKTSRIVEHPGQVSDCIRIYLIITDYTFFCRGIFGL